MKLFNRFRIKAFVTQLKTESISLRRRFYFFIISAIAIVLSLILLLFNLFGIGLWTVYSVITLSVSTVLGNMVYITSILLTMLRVAKNKEENNE